MLAETVAIGFQSDVTLMQQEYLRAVLSQRTGWYFVLKDKMAIPNS